MNKKTIKNIDFFNYIEDGKTKGAAYVYFNNIASPVKVDRENALRLLEELSIENGIEPTDSRALQQLREKGLFNPLTEEAAMQRFEEATNKSEKAQEKVRFNTKSKLMKGIALGTVAVMAIAGLTQCALNRSKPSSDNNDLSNSQLSIQDFETFYNSLKDENVKSFYKTLHEYGLSYNTTVADNMRMAELDGNKRMALSVDETMALVLAIKPYTRNTADAKDGDITPDILYGIFKDYKLDKETMKRAIHKIIEKQIKGYSRITQLTTTNTLFTDQDLKAKFESLENNIIGYNKATTKEEQKTYLNNAVAIIRDVYGFNAETVSREKMSNETLMFVAPSSYVIALAKPFTKAEMDRFDTEIASCDWVSNKFDDMEADLTQIQNENKLTATVSATGEVSLSVNEPGYAEYKTFTSDEYEQIAGFDVVENPELSFLDWVNHNIELQNKISGGKTGGTTTKSSSKTVDKVVDKKGVEEFINKYDKETQEKLREDIKEQEQEIQENIDKRNDPEYQAQYHDGYTTAQQIAHDTARSGYINSNGTATHAQLKAQANSAINSAKAGKSEAKQQGMTDAQGKIDEAVSEGIASGKSYLDAKKEEEKVNNNPQDNITYDDEHKYLEEEKNNANKNNNSNSDSSQKPSDPVIEEGGRPDFSKTTSASKTATYDGKEYTQTSSGIYVPTETVKQVNNYVDNLANPNASINQTNNSTITK